MKKRLSLATRTLIPAIVLGGAFSGCEVNRTPEKEVETNESAYNKMQERVLEIANATSTIMIKKYLEGSSSVEFIPDETITKIKNDESPWGVVQLKKKTLDSTGRLVSMVSVGVFGGDQSDFVDPSVAFVEAWSGLCPNDERTLACRTDQMARIDGQGIGFTAELDGRGPTGSTASRPNQYCLSDEESNLPECPMFTVEGDKELYNGINYLINTNLN